MESWFFNQKRLYESWTTLGVAVAAAVDWSPCLVGCSVPFMPRTITGWDACGIQRMLYIKSWLLPLHIAQFIFIYNIKTKTRMQWWSLTRKIIRFEITNVKVGGYLVLHYLSRWSRRETTETGWSWRQVYWRRNHCFSRTPYVEGLQGMRRSAGVVKL